MRELQSDYTQIRDPNYYDHPAWSSFRTVMTGREWGEQSLNIAWDFYRTGWRMGASAAIAEAVSVVVRGVQS